MSDRDSVIPRMRERIASVERELDHCGGGIERLEARITRMVDEDLPSLRRELAGYRADHQAEWARVRGGLVALGVIWSITIAIATVAVRWGVGG